MRTGRLQNLFTWSVVTCAVAPGCDGVRDEAPGDNPTGAESVSPAGREAVPEIEFTEQTAMALPEDRLLSGAVLSPSGDLVVAWFMGHPGVRLYDGSTPRDILVGEVGHAIGVEFLDENHLEIVDAASGDVVTADTAGVAHSRRGLPGSRWATAAARVANGWILATSGSDSTPSDLRMPKERGTWVPDSSYARTLGLSGGGRAALVWQGSSPFRVWRIGAGTDGKPVELARVNPDWFTDEVAQSLRLDSGIWSSTSVVAVGPGYVQTLAHRGTDERLLLRFDSHGRFLRYTRVEAPFGFVASATEAPAALAVRTLNASELVKYSTPACRHCNLEGNLCVVVSMLDGRDAPAGALEQFESPVYTATIELHALGAAYGSVDFLATPRRAGEIRRSCDGGIISKRYAPAAVSAIRSETAQLRL